MRLNEEQLAFLAERRKRNKDILALDPQKGYVSLNIENQVIDLLKHLSRLGSKVRPRSAAIDQIKEEAVNADK